jgi:FkbM family methyltransferase
MDTFETQYGKITLYKNEAYIRGAFVAGSYWDIDTMLMLKKYIDPNRNILEIGAHCGTSSIIYASFLNPGKKVYVYEPQERMFELLLHNIEQNNLQGKIIPFKKGVFCYSGSGTMNNIDLDGGGGNVQKRYHEEADQPCNFGGVCLGTEGEQIMMTTVDEMGHDDIGFIHCDAQGAEPFIFSAAKNLLQRDRPIVYYENNAKHALYLHDTVCAAHPTYIEQSKFDVEQYCRTVLNYKDAVYNFNGGIDDLILPDIIAGEYVM